MFNRKQQHPSQPGSATHEALSGLAPQRTGHHVSSGQGTVSSSGERDKQDASSDGSLPIQNARYRAGHALVATAYALNNSAVALSCTYLALYTGLALYRRFKQRKLRRLLKAVVPALRTAGATFWVDFGTLMGLYKRDDVYEGDNDTDIVILEPDFDHLLKVLPQLLPKGYKVEWCGKSRPLGDGLKQLWLRVYAPGGLQWTDLYGGYQIGDKIRINKGPECDLPVPMVLPLSSVRMMGSDAPAPRDVEMVLRTRYGPDWRVDKYASKGADATEHNKRYLRVLRALGRIGLRV